jgi:PKD repeat protein
MLITAVLLVSTLTVPVIGAPVAATTPEETLEKIEALVLDEIAAEGQTEFFVWMVEKADLSPADQLQTKQEKGRFVFNALTETADRTQKELRAYLDAQGVDYQAFYIANKVLVLGGDQALVMDLAARADVARITANHQFQLQEPFKEQPGREQVAAIEPNVTFINADDVWTMGYDGGGTVMAGNDTGLDETHPTIAPHYRGCLNPPTCTSWDHNYNWWDATGAYPNDPDDGHGHGTHTTGTMVGDDGGANQIGVAPGAQTVHCKNMTDGGSGDDGTFSECFQWDLAPWDLNGQNANPDLAPDAVNNSWGYWGGGQNQFRDEIQALHAAGILVEVSAGNEGSSCGSLRSPGDYWEVLTTGSVNHAAAFPGTITDFSSRGPSDLDPTPPNYFPDIMAPGESIRSALPGNTYGSWSGTSMAGPHATALVGLMWSACPAFVGRVEDTIQLIQDTAVPLTGQGGSNCGGDYTVGPNNDWGFGTIDAYAAVQAVLAQCTGLGALDGTVADGVTMAPIEGATITAEWDGGGQWGETTDASGYYTLTVPNGTYTVAASAFGYVGETVTGIVVTTDTLTTQDFDLAPATEYVISGTVTEAGTGAPLLAEVEVLDTPLSPVTTDPATGFYAISVPEGTYTFRVTAAQHQPEERVVVADYDQTQDFVLMQLPCILLVDDDNDNPDVLPYFSAALDNLDYDYDVFDVGGGGGNGPDLAGLQGYSMVLWFSGDKFGGSAGPNGTDEAALAAYLDGGGNLFLSSQDYLWDFDLTPFGEDYLGIGSYTDDTGDAVTKYGVAGDPIGGGLGPYPLTYPGGFSDYGDIVNAGAGASVAFRSSAGGGNNLDVDKDGGDWQTVFFGTSWVPVYNNNAANGEELLQRIIDWFGGCECQPVAGTALEWTPDAPTAGEAVTFTGTVAAGDLPVVYDWDFGDGEAASGQTVAHTYAAEGDYTVTLTSTNACGQDVAGDVINVLLPPCEPVEILEVVSTTAGCEVSFAAELAGDAPYTYTWDFGAFGSSDEMTPTVNFGLSGTYPYTLTVLNCEGTYSDTATGQVTVECEPPCVAVEGVTLTVVTTDTLYPGDEALFSADVVPDGATPPYTYTVDGGPEMTATTGPLSFTLSFEQPGTHTVEIAIWNCEMTVPVTGTADAVVWEPEEPIFYIYLPLVVKD